MHLTYKQIALLKNALRCRQMQMQLRCFIKNTGKQVPKHEVKSWSNQAKGQTRGQANSNQEAESKKRKTKNQMQIKKKQGSKVNVKGLGKSDNNTLSITSQSLCVDACAYVVMKSRQVQSVTG